MSIINYLLGIPTALAQVSNDAAKDVGSQTGNELAKLVASIFQQIPLWIVAIIVAFASYLVAVAVRRSIELKLSKEGIEEEHREVQIIAGRSAFFATLTLGVTVALSIVGIDLKPIVAAGAFGLGFALQDIIMNLIAGMMILAARHFTIGDVITVNGITGKVMEIQTRATIIKGFDGTKVIVPNAELFSNVVVSKTSNPFRKISFIMGVGYGSDLKQVMALTLAVVNSIPWVLKKPKSSVIFSAWGDSTIDFKINVWIDSKGGKFVKVKNRVIMDLTAAYDEAGVVIPYPIQTILMDKGDQAESEQATITEKMKQVKDKYTLKAQSKEQKAALVTAETAALAPAGQSWLQNSFKQIPQNPTPEQVVTPVGSINETPTAPISAPTSPIPLTPSPTPVTAYIPPVQPVSPNSEGQNWLQQALQEQTSQSLPTVEPNIQLPTESLNVQLPESNIAPTVPSVSPSQPNASI